MRSAADLEVIRSVGSDGEEPLILRLTDKNGVSTQKLLVRNGNASREIPLDEMHSYSKERFGR